ncbi:DUF4357 domain-containing protein [Thalassoglobus neptunius]|nr:DUF4357 domain-containing protein [Thalassoglobus neptunius]
MQRAKEVGRYTLENGQIPASSNYVPEPMEAELLDVFETISTLVSSLGYPVFEPISKPNRSSEQFYCQGGGSDGKGQMVEDGFVVYAGSRARIQVAPSATSSVIPQREKLISAGVLDEVEGEYRFTEDYLFSSPSMAAAVVLGRSANGWVEWKNEHGKTLSEIHREGTE